jgi:hypothetical protein
MPNRVVLIPFREAVSFDNLVSVRGGNLEPETEKDFQVGDEIADFRVAFLSSVLGDSGQLPSAH